MCNHQSAFMMIAMLQHRTLLVVCYQYGTHIYQPTYDEKYASVCMDLHMTHSFITIIFMLQHRAVLFVSL
jgi:hypothetical protein